MRILPTIPDLIPERAYDSMADTDEDGDPQIFVIQHAVQCYASYVITYKPTG